MLVSVWRSDNKRPKLLVEICALAISKKRQGGRGLRGVSVGERREWCRGEVCPKPSLPRMRERERALPSPVYTFSSVAPKLTRWSNLQGGAFQFPSLKHRRPFQFRNERTLHTLRAHKYTWQEKKQRRRLWLSPCTRTQPIQKSSGQCCLETLRGQRPHLVHTQKPQ